jgi:glutathione S-transferase
LTVDLRGQIVALPRGPWCPRPRPGLLDLLEHHAALALQLLALLEQRVAPLGQLLLGLERRRIRRRAGVAPVLAGRASAGEPQQDEDLSGAAYPRDCTTSPVNAVGLVVESRPCSSTTTPGPQPAPGPIFLAEKAVAYDTIEVSIAAAEHQSRSSVRRTRSRSCPCSSSPTARSRESMAIPPLHRGAAPRAQPARRRPAGARAIEQWNRHAELELLIPIAQVFRNTNAFWTGRIRQCPEYGEIMRELVASRFDWFDERARAAALPSPASRFTVADITALCAIDFGKVSSIRIRPRPTRTSPRGTPGSASARAPGRDRGRTSAVAQRSPRA